MIPTKPHLSHPKYRPDIDGLRAFAVLAVVGFHAFPNWVRGGFVGVDVFFVISGYLISTIIYENLDKKTFSFYEFYSRRIRRIFPALILILVFSFSFGWFTLLADEFKLLGKHIAAGAAFVSNFALWREVGYFDTSAETKPLLHLWSLGIEEQFYIVWPFLLWLAYKSRINILFLTVFIALVSFLLNVFGINSDATATFYSPQTRFWELLCGSLLAWLTLHGRVALPYLHPMIERLIPASTHNSSRKFFVHDFISLVGFALLAFGLLYIEKEFPFPGKWAVLPVIGTILIISAGPTAWCNRALLSNKVAVWFGLISFPLYLWHWPLLSFARIVSGEVPNRGIRIAAVALSIALAFLTYRFIERKIRFGGSNNLKVVVLLLIMFIVGFVGYNTYDRDGLSFREVVRINHTPLSSVQDGGDGGNTVSDCGISDEKVSKLFGVCAKDKRGNVHLALMGDSKAHSLYNGLVRTSNEENRWLFIGGNGPNGAPVPLLSMNPRTVRPLTVIASDAIAENKEITTVVLVTAIRSLFNLNDGVKSNNIATYDYKYLRTLDATDNYPQVFDELNRVVNKFIQSGKRVILVVDNPALPNPQDCIQRKTSISLLNKFLNRENLDCLVQRNTFEDQATKYKQLLNELKDAHPNSVSIFDPTDVYCDAESGVCGPIKNGHLMYSYTDHISDYAAGLVGTKLNSYINH